jgi:peroxiredoxin family protein
MILHIATSIIKARLLHVSVFFAFAAFPFYAQVKATAKKGTNKTIQITPHRIVYDMAAADTAQHSMLVRQLNKGKAQLAGCADRSGGTWQSTGYARAG